MPDLATLLAEGMAHHAAGRMAEAEALYRAVLERQPEHAEALHGMGVMALQVGKPAPAAQLLGEAVRRDPGNAVYLSNLASALRRAGRLEDARAAGLRVLELAPEFADGIGNLVNVLTDMQRYGEAAEALSRLVALRPFQTEPRLHLAHCLILDNQAEAAVEVLYDVLGMAPLSVAAYNNLGVALRRLGRLEEAAAAYRTALGFAPTQSGLLSNLGIVLQDLDRHEEAATCFRQAITAEPASATAYLNLSVVMREEMRMVDSVAAACAALRFDPDLAAAHTALGIGLLMQGAFREGFAEYEWRTRMPDFPSPKRSFGSPAWDGSDITGRTLVVHDEQGVGDALQFVRYAQVLQARGVRVIVECNTQLVRLFSRMPGITAVVGRFTPLPAHDFHVSMLSLPHLMGTQRDSIPAAIPYLATEPDLQARWAARLAPYAGLKVGLVWAGNPDFKGDRLRSPGLAAFRPVLGLPGVTVFALQKGPGRRDLETFGPLPPDFVDLGPHIEDFADTAAIMANLDLVISSCTGPAHLAGALGRPTWTVLPFSPDWRWLEQGEETPWYPTMRLFRQERRGDWAPVMARLRAALADR
ncbi:tetratricopeptide repeat protein [Novispirillum sp. DQ9]|uniref:tetratricopeptide repeat protein n=1 Tax=Novispirillum sp. DQ9 TaxID=3398612 RepID=UPI003C7A4D14